MGGGSTGKVNPHLKRMDEILKSNPKPPVRNFRVSRQTYGELYLLALDLLLPHQKNMNVILAHSNVLIGRTVVPSPRNVLVVDIGQTNREVTWISL